MGFRFNDISIHLMAADDKEKDKDKDKDKKEKKDKDLINPRIAPGEDDGIHGCGPDSGIATNKRRTEAGDAAQALTFLQAQLRATLAPPPV